ncbi:hypothetical protein GCM10027034_11210 [Ramlibacter solisilvae]|uniref:galactose oxidase-like domain-containing protein n=1 Tax=Ramlibacter tataouinensis TaxID=94132 RepID=UPI000777236F|nr:galactose oxidase-like domain-containing protein [Ramlibacter tataouinensis]
MMSRKIVAAALSCLVGMAAFLSPGAANAQTTGQWTRLQDFPVIPIHSHLLPNGKVMMWGRPGNQPYLWDPSSQAITALPGAGYDIFCAGHALLADGRLLVAGGHVVDEVGLANVSVFDPATNTWSREPDMNAGRWYPTVTALPNGDALVTSGNIDTSVGRNPLPQVYQAASRTWRDLTNAQLEVSYYPEMFVAPNGRLAMLGPGDFTFWLDTAGTGAWSGMNVRSGGWRDGNSAAMYADGKVVMMGGNDNPPGSVTHVIDLSVPAPAWRAVASMSFARRHLNSTLLPDGTVLVTGGTSGSGFNNETTPVLATELWNPATETWTRLANATVPRLYHSMALLLPDGRVITGGGDGHFEAEVFSPPYLFKGARPVITTAPASMGYGQQITVESPDAASIQKVTLIRLGSVTHGFNENQRMSTLPFTAGTGTLGITTPANANLAPPGHYMLFLVNGSGVPSVATVVRIGSGAPPPPPPAPTLGSLAPSSATAGGPAFTLTANGTNFVAGSTVRWNGTARTTTFVSATQLSAAITAADIAATGTAQVTVLNPGGAASAALPFTIAAAPPPAPTLGSLVPSSATAGGPAFTLTANGTNFVAGSTVRWNGTARTTTFVSATQLSAAITAADIAATGTAQVTVLNPGGAASAALPFTIAAAPPPAPTLGSLVPSSATAGGPAFTLTANGTNFVAGSTVRWNGTARTTTFVSATQLSAAITAADIAATGTAQVTVLNPGGAASAALPFTIAAAPPPAPTLGSLVPSTATAGGPAFTLTANGTNFVAGSTVRWNGTARTTTFVSATQLSAAITAADIAATGTAQVTVLNPGGAATAALPFTVTAPTSVLRVTKLGTGKGNINSAPAGISCGGTCTAPFASGATVTLTVKPTGQSVFAGWGGACAGTSNTCIVTINSALDVTATFNPR